MPVRISHVEYLALGRHRGPRVVFSGQTVLVAAIAGTVRGKDGDLVIWRSSDDGKTWSSGKMVNDVPGSAREGLHSLAAAPDGTAFLTWLDLRTGSMKLYGAVSRDGGLSWSPNRVVYESPDGHICECCHPNAGIGSKGELFAMWRNWKGGSRDMYLAASPDLGKSWSARKLGEGTWPLNACPMDGGGLTFDAGQGIHTAWRRGDSVYYVGPGRREQEIAKGKDPSIAASAKGVYMAWNEGVILKLKRPGHEPELLAAEGAYVTFGGSGPIFAAWEQKNGIAVARVD